MAPRDTKEAAHSFTGRDRDSHEPRIGVFISALPGDMAKLGFDLMRLDVNLTESTRERLRALYAARSAGWSKAQLRALATACISRRPSRNSS